MAGGGSSGAGLITGSLLLGTVAAEAVAAVAIRRFGCRMVLAAGAVLLGAPALAMLAREPQAVMVSVNVVRGLGFGLCGVVTGALAAKLLPPGRRGEGLGLVSGVPAAVALLIEQLPEAKASTLWNLAYDGVPGGLLSSTGGSPEIGTGVGIRRGLACPPQSWTPGPFLPLGCQIVEQRHLGETKCWKNEVLEVDETKRWKLARFYRHDG